MGVSLSTSQHLLENIERVVVGDVHGGEGSTGGWVSGRRAILLSNYTATIQTSEPTTTDNLLPLTLMTFDDLLKKADTEPNRVEEVDASVPSAELLDDLAKRPGMPLGQESCSLGDRAEAGEHVLCGTCSHVRRRWASATVMKGPQHRRPLL